MLQVNKLYHPWTGGIEKVVQNIAEGAKNKVAMNVLVCQPRGKGSCEFINGVQVHRAGSFGIVSSMPVSLSFPFLLKKLSKDKDILHFHEPFPLGVISYLLTKPKGKLVVWWHSDIVRQKKVLYLYKPFLLKFLKRADKIIVATADHIESSAFLKAFKHKCEIIPFGIDVKRFQLTSKIQQEIDKIREKYGSKIILFVGRLIYYKGIEYLIQAMKNVAGKLLLIGQGPLENKLREMISELHLEDKVVFLGKLDDQELVSYYHACDIFVLPSVANSEAFGMVQLEAMTCGKPVINTAIPTGVPQVSINGKTGITVPPKDADSLIKAINTLLDNEILRERYGSEASIRAQNCFAMEKMINKVCQTYKSLLTS